MLKVDFGDITILENSGKLSVAESHRIEMTYKAMNFCDWLIKQCIQLDYCVNHPEAIGCVDYHAYDSYLGDYAIGKHLLLQERKGKHHKFLVVTDSAKRVDLNILREGLSCNKLEFVGEEEMQSLINTTPGNISIFNMIYDNNREIQLVIDEDLLQAQEIAFHPLYNGMSVFMKPAECFKFLSYINRDAIIMPIAEKKKVLQK